MVNFVIYEDREMIRKNYTRVIHKFMGHSDCSYKIHQFSTYTADVKKFIRNNKGHNIYVLDIEVPGKSGLDLAREIRAEGDNESQIIIVTAHKELLENSFTNRSLILNFVSKFENCEENLNTALTVAYTNLTRYKSYVFKNEGELYRVPFDDILLFEIEPGTSKVRITTRDKNFLVKKTISSIIEELHDPRFMKTHKSCIVNLYNIEKVDLANLIIYFNNGMSTDLLSRNYKKEMQERLLKQG